MKTLAVALAAIVLLSALVVGMSSAKAADTTPPFVVSIVPANGATGVAVNSTVEITFSEKMDKASVQKGFSLSSGGTAVKGTFKWRSELLCAFTPSTMLGYSAEYTLTLSTGAKDPKGNTLASTFTSKFTTVPGTGVTVVTRVSPANGAAYVDVGLPINLQFSQPMNRKSIQDAFKLSGGGVDKVPGSFAWNSDSAFTFTPSTALKLTTVYTISISAGAKDLVGNALTPFSSQFTTAASTDVTPRVLGTEPGDGASGVDVKTTIGVAFSQPMDVSSVQDAFALSAGGLLVSGSFDPWSSDGKLMTFRPSSELNESTTYEVKVVAIKAKSAVGVPMAADFTSHFTTRQLSDIVAPIITCSRSETNSTQGIVLNIKDDTGGWGIEWNFLKVKDNGVDTTLCLAINEAEGNVTILAPNTVGRHVIEVTAVDMAGNVATKTCTVEVTMPSGYQQTDLGSGDVPQVACTAGNGRVTITWTASPPACCPVLKCVVYRGTSQDLLDPLVIVMGATYVDNSVINGQQYFYQVRVVYALGEGPASSAVGALAQTSAYIPSDTVRADPIASVGVLILLVSIGLITLMRIRRRV